MKSILNWGAQFGEQKWLRSRSLKIVVSAVAAFFAINYFFCPRFVIWKGLDLPDAWYFPELNRAVDALRQNRNPFAPIDHPSNDVLQWRLMFPLMAYCLAIPDSVYLVIPHIGCVVTLGWVAKLMLDSTGSGWFAFLGAIMMGTTSWFFVSTGWLAYFDSWYILGLLLTAFHPARWLLVASCLLVPWIDERFVLALPLAICVRTIFFKRNFQISHIPFLYDVLVVCSTILPWVAFRAVLIYQAKDSSPSATVWQTPLGQPGIYWTVLDGWWNGLRGLWGYIIVYYAISMYRGKILPIALITMTTVMALVLNLRFAGDFSRSVSNITPLVLLGVLESIHYPKFAWKKLLYVIVAVNLILPASHVVSAFKIPIFYWPYEKYHLRNPPVEFTAKFYNDRGVKAWLAKDGVSSLQNLSTAIRLDPMFAEGYLNRGIIESQLSRFDEAESDMRRATKLNPTFYVAQMELAQLLMKKGDKAEAVLLLQAILANAPETFEFRRQVEKLLVNAQLL